MKITKNMINIAFENLTNVDAVKKVYRKYSQILHPDKNGNSAESNELQAHLTKVYNETLKKVSQQKSHYERMAEELGLDLGFIRDNVELIKELQVQQKQQKIDKAREEFIEKVERTIESCIEDDKLIDDKIDRGKFQFSLNIEITSAGTKVEQIKSRRTRSTSTSSNTIKYKVRYKFYSPEGDRMTISEIAAEFIDNHDIGDPISAVSFLRKINNDWVISDLKLGNITEDEINSVIEPFKVKIEDK